MDLKREREQFVINEEGTSTLRYMVFCVQMNFSLFITKLILNTFPTFQNNRFLSFFIEFICLHSFTIFSSTILDDFYLLVFGLQIAIIVLFIYPKSIKHQINTKKEELKDESISFKNNKFKENSYDGDKDKPIMQKNPIIRSLFLNTLVSTTIMILAVDFKVCPRRNGKIEHFGLGLMDAGAICFLSINSITSPEVRLFNQSKSSKLETFKKNFKPCLTLIMLGLMRLYTTKNLNYQEHVSEYGVHMNFFLLLALIKLLGSSLSLIFNKSTIFNPLFGFLLICLHEVLLTKFDLSSYIQHDGHRETFLDKNKESFFTLIGYLGFYLSCYNVFRLPYDAFGVSGDCLKNKNETELNYNSMIRSFKYALTYLILYKLSDLFSEQISRRNMNMAFTCLALSILYLVVCLEHLFSNLLIKYYSVTNTKLILQDSFTNNGLITFLISNILTGFVNMSMNTLQVTNQNALVLLFAYSFVVSISVCFLDTLNNFY